MIIECSSCHARYQYDEARFEGKPSKKIRCAKCANVFEIRNPAKAERPAPRAAEQTRAPRPKPSPPPQQKEPPRSTGKMGALLQLPSGRRLSIAVIDGAGAGTVYRIGKARVTIGRSEADFVIEDQEASRQHAAIEIRDTIYLLSDLDSRNGTIFEGQKVREPVEIQDKSEFVIGTTTLMFIVTNEG